MTFLAVFVLVILMGVYLRPEPLAKEEDPDEEGENASRLDPLKVLMWSAAAGVVAAGMGVFFGKSK